MKMAKTLLSAALTLVIGMHQVAYADSVVSASESSINQTTTAAPEVNTANAPTINLSIVTGAADLVEGDYLNYQEYMLFEYIANKIVNDESLSKQDRKDFLGYLNLTRFMVQMESRHKELKQLSAHLMKSDKETGGKIVQLIMAEQATLSNESFKFINSTGLAHEQHKLNPRMLYLEQTINGMIKNIDYDDMNQFISNLKAEYEKEQQSKEAEETDA